MTIHNEYRVARSATDDSTFNTLELKRTPSFAVMEFLDPGDSQYFAKTLRGKRWRDATPEPHKSRKTLEHVPVEAGELEAFKDVQPDWLYLSGHYGRTYYSTSDNKVLTVLPAGFFNEPFHIAEWESAWTKVSAKGAFLQGEFLDDPGGSVYHGYIPAQSLVHREAKFHSLDERGAAERSPEWLQVWKQPTADLTVSGQPVPGARGLLFTHVWSEVKLLFLVCCNGLVWGKQGFHKAFPNALVLGWLGKNPANATPFIRQFLTNAFRGVKDPADPILMDHEHLSRAWTDMYFKQRMYKSAALGYMLPSGEVFSVNKAKDKPIQVGTVNDVTPVIVPSKPYAFAYFQKADTFTLEP